MAGAGQSEEVTPVAIWKCLSFNHALPPIWNSFQCDKKETLLSTRNRVAGFSAAGSFDTVASTYGRKHASRAGSGTAAADELEIRQRLETVALWRRFRQALPLFASFCGG
jgi:hypothetical protein